MLVALLPMQWPTLALLPNQLNLKHRNNSMNHTLQQILDCSEIWALFIPLILMVSGKENTAYLKPVRIYVWVALIISVLIVLIAKRNQWFGLPKETSPEWIGSNNFLYNLLSTVRFLLFSWFFILLNQKTLSTVKKVIPLVFIFCFVINFIFFEDFFSYWSFSGRLLSIEATILLFYCLLYYMHMLNDDESSFRKSPSFWVVTGLSIYVVINVPIFLFYIALYKQFEDFTLGIWDIHNISYIIFCIFLGKAFYESRK